jgi:hypothetical protein
MWWRWRRSGIEGGGAGWGAAEVGRGWVERETEGGTEVD